jgi:hypothetical protein
MSKEDLPIYLNDHLAGSVGALELLDHLIKTYKENPLEQFFKDLRSEIDADQDTLQDLIEKLGMKESADWSSIFESSRNARQRKPSHLGSYCHSSPTGTECVGTASWI